MQSDIAIITQPPRVILPTLGSRGDLEPFILMGHGLQARGYRVCVLASRDHEPRLVECGLPHRLYGTVAQTEAMLNDPNLWDERKGLRVIGRGLTDSLDEIVELMATLASDGPCIALSHPLMLPAAAIARSIRPGLRIVGAWLAPSNLRTVHDPLTIGSLRVARWVPLAWRRALWRFVDRQWIDSALLPGLNAGRSAHRMAPVEHFFQHLGDSCDASVGLFPDWFARPARDWPTPFHQLGFPLAAADEAAGLSAEVERFLAEGLPPIVFTFGTGMRHARATFESGRDVLSALGMRGLFISSHKAQIPKDLPNDILWASQAPFETLIPRVAAIVHHGGIGTTAQALRAGIPQLVIASGFDQFDNGERLRSLGVGDVLLPASRASRRAMRRRLKTLLASPTVREACERIKHRFDARDAAFIDRLGQAIEDVASGRQAQPPMAGRLVAAH